MSREAILNDFRTNLADVEKLLTKVVDIEVNGANHYIVKIGKLGAKIEGDNVHATGVSFATRFTLFAEAFAFAARITNGSGLRGKAVLLSTALVEHRQDLIDVIKSIEETPV